MRRFCSWVKQRSSQTAPGRSGWARGAPGLTPPWVWGRGTGRLPPLYANAPPPARSRTQDRQSAGGSAEGAQAGGGRRRLPAQTPARRLTTAPPQRPGLDCRHAHVRRSARTRSGSFSLIGPTRPRLTPACTSPPQPVGGSPSPTRPSPVGGGAERRQQELPRYQIPLLLSSA